MAKKKAKSTRGGKKKQTTTGIRSGPGRVIAGIICFAVAALLVVAFYFKSAGAFGSAITGFFFGVFGKPGYAVPIIFIAVGLLVFIRKHPLKLGRNAAYLSGIYFAFILIFAGFDMDSAASPLKGAELSQVYKASANGNAGGIIGMYVDAGLVKILGVAGMFIFGFVLLAILSVLMCYPYAAPHWESHAEKRAVKKQERAERKEERRRAKEARFTGEAITKKTGFIDSLAEGGGPGEYRAVTEAKQAKILSAVNDDETITGDAGDDIIASRKADTGLHPEEILTGYGVDPVRVGEPGKGLGDEYNEGFASPSRPGGREKGSGAGGGIAASAAQASANGVASGGGESDDPFDFDDIDSYDPEANAASMDGALAAAKAPPRVKKAPPKPDALASYKLPPIDLLNKSRRSEGMQNAADLRHRAGRLEQALKDFRVDASVVNVTVGPTVTRYEVEPDIGVKIQSIKSLEPDLALKLEVDSVRVVPMPGKAVIGIEASNTRTTLVTLRDIIDSPEFRMADSKISFVLGKDISGTRMIEDLAEMPHLLIAGTTGSGKSVCINSILLSILYRARPDEVKFIMIDPKIVELRSYNDIPHLLLPVVSEPERAATALGYAVTIMEERYRKFANMRVSSLQDYNKRIASDANEEVLPQIVIVIDELSDLMLIAPAKVQEYINRLAAKARAAGIHLIVATQQPLASILTSVIKANIPSRIAFSVASNSSSRVILDEPGAERLLGKGDMLFKSVSMREPVRIQGSFVNMSEVKKVTDYIRKQMDPDYSPDIMEVVTANSTGQLTEDEDEFFRDAVEMVVAAKQASVSMIQRRFRIGYNRAARLVDMMEERGVVAGSDGTNKPRKVIMSNEQLNAFLGEGRAAAGGPDSAAGSARDSAPAGESAGSYDEPPFDMSDDEPESAPDDDTGYAEDDE
ncbi:MAG: DNA translocase FtsK [Clostridiales Family XIII bacterium]|jgi:S-DNA-T family DNA segregation ATPase FtsK/SpoIIIE|nr:DNA translocase FtsK [Clostridiales Family XIII bacterium]